MLTVFRDLPGIRRIEEIFQHPHALSSERRIDTVQAIDDTSNSLFCVTEYDTWPEDDWDDERLYAHEAPYHVCDLPWGEARAFWEAIGWDISDGEGAEHPNVHYFARQIIAAVRGLMPEAKFCPAGDGKAAFDSWGDPLDSETTAEEKLKAEVARFFEKRGRSESDHS